jgi:ribonuclease HI
MHLKINIDGAARGNPGPAAFAYVISRPGGADVEESGCIGKATNNVAEYTALVRALERAAELGGDELHINSDSELLVKQMNGEYRVKNADLRTLYDDAKELCRRFKRVSIRHIPRAENSRADHLCNVALDGPASKPGGAPAREKRSPSKTSSVRRQSVREEAILCLEAAAGAWASGNANHLSAEDVWDQLWSILEEHGALHPTVRH